MALTFLATTQLPLQQAIVLGAILSLLLYCAQAARQARFLALTRDPEGRWHLSDPPDRLPPGDVTVLYYAGTSFFAELPRIEQALPRADDAHGAVLILVVRGAPDVPSATMAKVIRRHARELDRQGGRLILAGVTPGLARILRMTGVDRDLGPGGIVPAAGAVFEPLDRALADARSWIAARSGEATDGTAGLRTPPDPPT
ncbi:SulP family inorganic anion transporter [Streptomyces rubradiris]|uniref:STAS domain-containing protein n=1 Tax=Streptomyces rubradiris TaxID=285531 RepID=A0ABQ3RKP8_STRRR|nr:SulP family inorganic anion transporter [Streptomyces rubradiris]GHH11405.1 hypothetical protein GCM10018792_36070 [Streptomyces rubradiris]GHI56426.1 hypothetical protein Srubr_62720 [Streptomyces rubradiris]